MSNRRQIKVKAARAAGSLFRSDVLCLTVWDTAQKRRAVDLAEEDVDALLCSDVSNTTIGIKQRFVNRELSKIYRGRRSRLKMDVLTVHLTR